MSRELNDMQQAFIEHFVESGDARAAALAAGYSEATVSSKASQLKRDLAPEIAKAVQVAFADGAPAALAAMREIIANGQNESARMRAIDSWLDRAGHKPVEKTQEVRDERTLEDIVTQMCNEIGAEATAASLRYRQLPERLIAQLLGDGYVAPAEPVRPAIVEHPESKSEIKHKRTLAELAAERKRFNIEKRRA